MAEGRWNPVRARERTSASARSAAWCIAAFTYHMDRPESRILVTGVEGSEKSRRAGKGPDFGVIHRLESVKYSVRYVLRGRKCSVSI